MPLSFAAQGYFFAKKCRATSEIGNQNFFKIHFIWGSYSVAAWAASSVSAFEKRFSSIRQ